MSGERRSGGTRFRFNMTLLLLSALLLAILLSANGLREFRFGPEEADDASLELSDSYVVLDKPKGEVILFLVGWFGIVVAVGSLAFDGARAAWRRIRGR